MDLTLDNLRELFQNMLGNTGGRRGRDREQVRQQQGGQPDGQGSGMAGDPADQGFPGDPAAQADAQQGDGQMQGGQQQGQEGGTPTPPEGDVSADGNAGGGSAGGGGGSGTTFDQDRPDSDELEDDEVVDDLYHRIETLEEELERNGNRLGSIRDAQESVSDDIEEVNDTVRRLLGVYDRLTEQVNPFTGAGEEAEGFGVFGENHHEGFGLDGQTAESDQGAVSFDDLRAAVESSRSGGEAQRIPFEDELDDEPDRQRRTGEPSADAATDVSADAEDGASVEVQATAPVEEEDEAGTNDEPDADEADAADVTLSNLADSYAADVLVFEWLTQMVRTGGPSATLRAISYYHEIGWIDDDVRDHLEAVLSGPDLDMHVDPERTPEELTAEDHADSYEYIMKLQEVHEASAEVEL